MRLQEPRPAVNGTLPERDTQGDLAALVGSVLELRRDPKLDSLVTAYCQQFGIGSRVASFLVLENQNDYKRLNPDAVEEPIYVDSMQFLRPEFR